MNQPFSGAIPERGPYEGNATQKQKQLLWDLGCQERTLIDGLGKRQASALITQLKAHHGRAKSKRLWWLVAALAALMLLGLLGGSLVD
jgi:hypothetical protein